MKPSAAAKLLLSTAVASTRLVVSAAPARSPNPKPNPIAQLLLQLNSCMQFTIPMQNARKVSLTFNPG